MQNNLLTIIGIFTAIGVPSIFAMTMWCINKCHEFTKRLKVLAESQQAQMRSQLLSQYKVYMEQGWISLDDLDDWENQYQKYHLLGENGVLDTKREQLLMLPNTQGAN